MLLFARENGLAYYQFSYFGPGLAVFWQQGPQLICTARPGVGSSAEPLLACLLGLPGQPIPGMALKSHMHCSVRCSDLEFFHISLDANPLMVA